ncbi:MAG: carboxypeptidase-like regulatory domain-containing protein [Bacteroidia bacterium]
MIRSLVFGSLLLCSLSLSAQGERLTQVVRGIVTDSETGFPLVGATVRIDLGESQTIGSYTDEAGKYRLERVPVGRQTVTLTYSGYSPAVLNNIIVSSAKEVILDVAMEISTLEEVTLVARRNGEVSNEFAPVSAREFSIDETNRFAGSRGEPARMAANYAGVQGADDSRNDIVIRGNSPGGVLWRLEGISIPNPNHFAIPGTGGGPVTILNNKFLSNSDFYTGAFPAEFGNGVAGVFDLRMRNGNNERHEFSGQFGFLGTELTAEGPISRASGASYLAMYRYSTLALFGFLNIDVGTDAIPNYQDGAIRLNFPLKNGATLSAWAVAGLSDVDIILSEQDRLPAEADLYADNSDRDQYFGSNMAVAAVKYDHPLSLNARIVASIGYSYQLADTYHDQIFRTLQPDSSFLYATPPVRPILDYEFRETKIHSYVNYTRRIDNYHTIKAGVYFDMFNMNYFDSARVVIPDLNGGLPTLAPWRTRWLADEWAPVVQPFINYKYSKNRLSVIGGLTSLYFGLNDNSFSPIEPRLGLSYQVAERQKISFGTGLHSQMQSPYLYFYGRDTLANGSPIPANRDMGLTKSAHAVLGYDMVLGKNMRVKAETYFQYLYEIPVEIEPSSFSLVNAGSGFSRVFPDSLQNTGIGRNFGVELTLERFFTQGYYFLLTGSLFDAQYQGSDGVWRNTVFNGRVAFNGLVAKEFQLKGGSAINIGLRGSYVGGRWYGPVDFDASNRELELVYVNETVNTLQHKPYMRLDGRVSLLWNRARVTHELAIDLVNFLDIQNILTLTYVQGAPNPIREEYQLGFLPLFYYKIDFKGK